MAARQLSDRRRQTEATADDKRAVRRLLDAVYSAGELRVLDEVAGVGIDGYCNGTDTSYEGISGLKAHAVRLRATFPGLDITLEEFHRASDGFEARLILCGRFERPFGGVEPTCRIGAAGDEPRGEQVRVTGRVAGTASQGQLTELTFEWDLETLTSHS